MHSNYCLHRLILIENIALIVNIRLHSTIYFVDVAYFSMRHGFLRISAKYSKELSLIEIKDVEFEEEVESVHKMFLENITIKLAPDYARICDSFMEVDGRFIKFDQSDFFILFRNHEQCANSLALTL